MGVFSKKTIKSKDDRNFVTTVTGQGVVGGVDKLIDTLKLDQLAKAYGMMFTGNGSNITTFEQFKSTKATLYNRIANVDKVVSSIFNEIQKISSSNVHDLLVSKISSQISDYGDAIVQALSVQQKPLSVSTPGGTNEAADAVSMVAKAVGNVDSTAAKSLNELLDSISSYKGADLSNVKETIGDLQAILKTLSKPEYRMPLSAQKQTIYELGDIMTGIDSISYNMQSVDVNETKMLLSSLESLAKGPGSIESVLDAYSFGDVDISSSSKAISGLSTIAVYLTNIKDTLSKAFANPDIKEILSNLFDVLVDTASGMSNFAKSTDVKTIDDAKATITSLEGIIKDGSSGLASFIESISNLSNIDFKAISDNADDMSKALIAFAEAMKKIPEVDQNKNYTIASKAILDDVQGYEKNMAKVLESQRKGNTNATAVVNGYKEMSKNVEDAIDESENIDGKSSNVALANVTGIIMGLGAMMIIGSLISEKHPSFIRDAYRFGAALVVFVTVISGAVLIVQKIADKNAIKSFEGLGRLVMSAGATMLIGAWVYMKFGDEFSTYVRRFMLDFAIMIGLTAVAIRIMTKFMSEDTAKTVEAYAKLITRCTIIMLIGALFVQNERLRKNAFYFGAVLGGFILCVTAPLILMSLVFRKAITTTEGLGGLVVSCTLVMAIGAMVVTNAAFVQKALMFGLVLGLFITEIMLPLRLISNIISGERKAFKAIREINRLVVTMSLMLIVGALFMQNEKLVLGALAFGALVAGFIFAILGALKLAMNNIDIRSGFKFVRALNRLVVMTALTLMIGGVYMTNTELALGALKFAGLVVGFTVLMALVIRVINGSFDNKTMKSMGVFMVFTTMMAAILYTGTYFVYKYGVKNILVAAGTMFAFALAMSGVFWLLTNIENTRQGLLNGLAIAAVTAVLGLAFGIVNLTMNGFELEKMLIFAAGAGLMTIIFVGLSFIKHTKEALLNGLAIAAVTAVMGLAFGLVNIAMNGFEWEKLLMFAAGVAMMATIFGIIGIGPISKAVKAGSINSYLIALGIGLLGIAIGLMHEAVQGLEWEDLAKMTATVGAFAVIFGIIGITPIAIAVGIGSAVALLMGVAMGNLGIAIRLMHEAVKDMRWEELGLMTATVGALAAIFGIIGLIPLSIMVGIGSTVALGMSAAMVYLSMAIVAARKAVKDDPTKDVKVFGDATKALVDIFSQYGLKTAAKIEISEGVAMSVSKASDAMSIALVKLHTAVEESRGMTEQDLKLFSSQVSLIVSLFNSSNPESPFHNAKMDGVLKATWSIRMAVNPMVKTISKVIGLVKDIATLNVPDKWDANGNPTHYERLDTSIFPQASENIITSVSTLVESFATLIKKPEVETMIKDFQSQKGIFGGSGRSSVANVVKITKYISQAVGLVGDTLYKFALLMVPDKFDNNGNPTHYKQLNTSIFKTASDNIMDSVKSLVNGFLDIYKIDEVKDLVDDMQTHAWYMGNGKSKVASIFSMTKGISEMISGIASSVQAFASSRFPDRWNDNGVATHYQQLKEQDFKNAADRVCLVISTMLDGIEQFGKDHAQLLKEFEQEGFWNDFTGTPRSTVSKAAKMSEKIGQIISNISNTLSNYAKLMIPNKWDPKTGTPTHFVPFSETDFETAKTRIVDILTTIPEAISSVEFPNSEKRKARRLAKAIGGLSTTIGEIAKIVVDIKSMRIPIYKADKLEPTGYMNFDGDMSDVTTNITTILSELPKAINKGYDSAIKEDKKALENIANISSAYKPVTDLLSGMITSIQSYATLKAMPIYDGNGKLIKTVDLTPAIDGLGENIGKILTALIDGVDTGYAKFKAAIGGGDNTQEAISSKIGSVISDIKPITEVFESLVNTITAYAELKAPKYDNKGNIVGYYTLIKDNSSFKKLFGTISDNLSKIMSGLLSAVETSIHGSWIANDDKTREEIIAGISKITDIVGPITDVITIMQDLSNLKFPTGFDKDGKATGYFTASSISADTIAENISKILTAVPNAVSSAWADSKATIKKLVGDGTKTSAISIMSDAYNSMKDFIAKAFEAVEEYANFKIPVEFDNNGNPKKHLGFDKKSISNLEDTISNIICAIPNAMHKSISSLAFSDEDTAKFNEISNRTTTAINIISDIYNNESINNIMSIIDDGGRFNNALSILSTLTSNGLSFIQLSSKNVNAAFSMIEDNFIGDKAKHNAVNRVSIIEKANSLTVDFMNLINALSLLSSQSSTGVKTAYSTSTFAMVTKALADASGSMAAAYEELSKIGSGEGISNAKDMLSSINNEAENIKEETTKKFDKQAKVFEKYVQAVGKVDIRKADSMTRMFDMLNQFSKSVGNLDKFTDTLANKIAVELKAFTAELKSAEKTISNADKLRKEREKTMEKTLSKISEIMNQTLNVTVSSKTGDSISGSQTFSEE